MRTSNTKRLAALAGALALALSPGLSQAATQKYFACSTAGATTCTMPADLGSVAAVYALGPGGAGSVGVTNTSTGAGGSGGSFATTNPASLASNSTLLGPGGRLYISANEVLTVQVPAGGTPGGTAPVYSYLKDDRGQIVVSAGPGVSASSTTAGGNSSQPTNCGGACVYTGFNYGGKGASGSANVNSGGPGGGGAAGLSGGGATGGVFGSRAGGGGGGGANGGSAGATPSNNNTQGGGGGNGAGGTGGGASGTSTGLAAAGTLGGGGGGAGAYGTGAGGAGGCDTSMGAYGVCGGGGGGFANASVLGPGGAGGQYGGGGGGGGDSASGVGSAGSGGQGLIVILYNVVTAGALCTKLEVGVGC